MDKHNLEALYRCCGVLRDDILTGQDTMMQIYRAQNLNVQPPASKTAEEVAQIVNWRPYPQQQAENEEEEEEEEEEGEEEEKNEEGEEEEENEEGDSDSGSGSGSYEESEED